MLNNLCFTLAFEHQIGGLYELCNFQEKRYEMWKSDAIVEIQRVWHVFDFVVVVVEIEEIANRLSVFQNFIKFE